MTDEPALAAVGKGKVVGESVEDGVADGTLGVLLGDGHGPDVLERGEVVEAGEEEVVFVALRGLESRQPGLESHGEGGLGGELVQSEVLTPELSDEREPPAWVQQVLVRLDGGGGGEGEQTHRLLDHQAVLLLGF